MNATEAAGRFEGYRATLVRHAYRMLGDRAESDDVVQDAYVRWETARAREAIVDDGAFLRATVTRLCLDRLRSARARREVYVGPWLPEPIVGPEGGDPETAVTLADDVSFALLLALERLSALERAAFLLHDVMDVPFAEIAVTLGRSEDAVKQLASRARSHVREPRARRVADAAELFALRDRFAAAIVTGNLSALQAMLADGVVFLSDAGGKRNAAINPIHGPDRVGRLIIGIASKSGDRLRSETALINGSPGFVSYNSEGVEQTLAFDVIDGRIAAIYVTRNPDKLRGVPADGIS